MNEPEDQIRRELEEARAALSEEIARHRATAEELKMERFLLESLMEHLPEHIYFKDAESRFIRINKSLAFAFGLNDPAAASGKTDFDFFSDEHAKPAFRDEQEIMKTGEGIVDKVEKETWKNGPPTWASTTKVPLYDDEGKIVGTFGISHNITEQKRVEEELRHERYLLRSLMDSLPDKVFFKDADSRFLRINQVHAEQFGLDDPEEAVGKSDFDFFTEEHARQAYEDEVEIVRSGLPIVDKQQRITLPDGRSSWVSVTKMPLFGPGGSVVGTFGVSRDISAIKRAQEELQSTNTLLRTLIDILPCRIFVKDTESRYLINNQAHLRLLGVSSQAGAAGRTAFDFFPDERGRLGLEDDRSVIDDDKPYINREEFDTRPGGKKRWVLTSKVPFRDQHGKIAGLVGMSLDITEQKEIEEQLRERNSQMEADLAMARQIQEAFLPSSDSVERVGLRCSHRYLPSSHLAGDFFDLLQIGDGRVGLLICDVMGHGVRASLVTALLRGLVEERMPSAGDPGPFLTEVNRGLRASLRQVGSVLFVTAVYLVVDVAENRICFANAGHPAPLLIRAAGGVDRPGDTGGNPEPALGLIGDFTYSTIAAEGRPGDRALLFTDGLTEARDPAGEEYGEERLAAAVAGRSPMDADALLDGILDDVKAFAAKAEFDDDVCLLAVDL